MRQFWVCFKAPLCGQEGKNYFAKPSQVEHESFKSFASENTSMETDNFEDLYNYLSSLSPKSQIISIDGIDGVGKSTLAAQLADSLNRQHIDLDAFLNKNKRTYTEEIRIDDFKKSIHSTLSPIILSGVCMQAVLNRANLVSDCLIYLKRISLSGWVDDDFINGNELEEMTKSLSKPTTSYPFQTELLKYHQDYRPHINADIIFLRHED